MLISAQLAVSWIKVGVLYHGTDYRLCTKFVRADRGKTKQ